MTENNTQSPAGQDVQFHAVLRPHRSLSGRGFLILMALIGGVSFIAGCAFLMIGAWPVFGFFGLDVAIIYYAFRRNFADAKQCEIFEISDHKLSLTRFDRHGHIALAAEFNPRWVRLEVDEGHGGRTALRLVSSGKSHTIARFLTDDERRSFADALSGALARASGVRI